MLRILLRFHLSVEQCTPLDVINGEATACTSPPVVGTLCIVQCYSGHSIDATILFCQPGDTWSGVAECIGENVISYVYVDD